MSVPCHWNSMSVKVWFHIMGDEMQTGDPERIHSKKTRKTGTTVAGKGSKSAVRKTNLKAFVTHPAIAEEADSNPKTELYSVASFK